MGNKNMNPEGAVEAIFGIFITVVLIYVFAEVVFTLQGPFWAVIFVIASIAILISYTVGEV